MADLNFNMFGDISGFVTTFKNVMIVIIICFVVGVLVFVWLFRKSQNKKFNIPLIIITPRSDGRVVEVNKGWGGYFKSKKVGGITSFRIKRKGIGVVDIPPPSSSYLSSPDRTLFLAQKGVDDYEPIMPDQLSFVDTDDGLTSFPILKLKAVNQSATAWAFDNEETAKRRFTFSTLWDKYQTLISLLLVIFVMAIFCYILYMGQKDLIIELKNLVTAVKGGVPDVAPIITQG